MALEPLSHLLRKTIVTKKLHTTGYMGIILHTLTGYVGETIEHGHMKHGVLYIRIVDHGKKMNIFRDKKKIIELLHKTLGEYGYNIRVQDIRFMN